MSWKTLAKISKLLGVIGFVLLDAALLYLVVHWRNNRPRIENPDFGWTVALPWCAGAYGTLRESSVKLLRVGLRSVTIDGLRERDDRVF